MRCHLRPRSFHLDCVTINVKLEKLDNTTVLHKVCVPSPHERMTKAHTALETAPLTKMAGVPYNPNAQIKYISK